MYIQRQTVHSQHVQCTVKHHTFLGEGTTSTCTCFCIWAVIAESITRNRPFLVSDHIVKADGCSCAL